MKKITTYAGSVIALASFAFFATYLFRYASQWPTLNFGPRSIAIIIGLIAFQMLVATCSALAWRTILSFAAGPLPSRTRAVSIYCKSQFAKFIPGNVAQHIGRALLAKQAGLSVRRVALSLTIETLWTIGCAGAVALFALGQFLANGTNEPTFHLSPELLLAVSVIAVFAPVFVLPKSLQYIQSKFPERVPSNIVLKFPIPKSFACLCAYLLSFVFLGVAMNGIASAVLDQPTVDIPTITSICALAWVAGFVTPGAPAGLGVREAILLLLLEPIYGAPAASSLALGHRLLTALGDLAVYGLGVIAAKRERGTTL